MAAHDPHKRADALARSLTDLLTPVVADAGLRLEGVETTRAGRYSVVRVFVDLADGPGDLDLDALGPVTAAVSQALDEADPVKGQYTLEVSTPGAERELSTLRHFRRAVGHSARVRTADEELTGVVTGADPDNDADDANEGNGGGMVRIEVDGVERGIALEDITEARMVVAGL
ncbi:ribosome maturation factor RimP [Actinomyces sp. ZJ308]|uniref:ribosome maturation factor RimP n=1 Tax=Actinomyces sp. ZJ308 TaxID=2708342 RepID=UPI00141F8F82|nr:ribosome maturation factor RimP [Actinomyces sp. ZJ308]